MDKLQPCPFCGHESSAIVTDNVDMNFMVDTELFGYTVLCSGLPSVGGCGATCGYRDTKEDAIKHWNTRLMLV